MELFPTGDVSLTGLTSLMKSRKVDDPQYHWWDKTLVTQRAAVTGRYTDAQDGAVGAGAADPVGTTKYWAVSKDDSKMFRPGMVVLLRDASNLSADYVARISGIIAAGADSRIITVSLQTAPFSAGNYGPQTIDVILGIGNSNPEGGVRPEAITISPMKRFNYTQIFRDSLDLTRTKIRTTLRTAPAYQTAKKDALLQHGIGMEKAFLFGVATESTGINGKMERTTEGIYTSIKNNGVNASFSGNWANDGDEWIDEQLEKVFRYGSSERLAFCGSGALLGIQQLAKKIGTLNIEVGQTSWGVAVRTWITPFGTVTMMIHPLFSYEVSMRHQTILFEPANIEYRYIDDTMFKPDMQWRKGGGDGVDGPREEYLTEAGLEFHHPETGAILSNVGG